MKNVSVKVVEKLETRVLYSVNLFVKRAVYEMVWKNTVQRDRPQMTIWRMRIACWISKATNTHSEYVILVVFPLQQWFHERASVLYVHCLACFTYSATMMPPPQN